MDASSTTGADGSDVEALRRVPIFRRLDDPTLCGLLRVAVYRTYGEGALMVGGRSQRESVTVVAHGSARLFRVSPRGGEVTLATFGPGDVAGLALLAPTVTQTSLLAARVDGTGVFHIGRHEFQRWVAAHGDVGQAVLEHVCGRLAAMLDRVEELALYDVRTRLAHALLELAADGQGQTVYRTQQELAAMIGTSREEVNRGLRHFRRLGLVRCTTGRIELQNPARLARM